MEKLNTFSQVMKYVLLAGIWRLANKGTLDDLKCRMKGAFLPCIGIISGIFNCCFRSIKCSCVNLNTLITCNLSLSKSRIDTKYFRLVTVFFGYFV